MCYMNCPYEDSWGECAVPGDAYPEDAFCQRGCASSDTCATCGSPLAGDNTTGLCYACRRELHESLKEVP